MGHETNLVVATNIKNTQEKIPECIKCNQHRCDFIKLFHLYIFSQAFTIQQKRIEQTQYTCQPFGPPTGHPSPRWSLRSVQP